MLKNYQTERLQIKPISNSDAAFILELYNSPKFIRFIGDRNLKTMDEAANYIAEKFLPMLEEKGYGNYVIKEKDTQKTIGAVGIFEREGLSIPDIGFSFMEEFQGKGFAFEAASKVKEIAMQEFSIEKLCAITAKDNYSSQKLLNKLGLKVVGTVTLPGDDVELLYLETEN